jgi:hypothetical protein
MEAFTRRGHALISGFSAIVEATEAMQAAVQDKPAAPA